MSMGRMPYVPAALAGADSIEHGNYIDRDCIDAMKEKGTVWVPTLVTTGNLLGCGRYPQEELEKIFDSARANVSCAWEKGRAACSRKRCRSLQGAARSGAGG